MSNFLFVDIQKFRRATAAVKIPEAFKVDFDALSFKRIAERRIKDDSCLRPEAHYAFNVPKKSKIKPKSTKVTIIKTCFICSKTMKMTAKLI